jgi:dihydrofolate reductase
MSFSLIAAIGQNNELGKKGGLVFKIPGDLKFFKETTVGHPVFMGLNTWRSLPGKLPGREHYVLAPDAKDVPDDLHAITDLDQFVDDYKESDTEFFIIGGGMVYKQLLPHCNKLYLTEAGGFSYILQRARTTSRFIREIDEEYIEHIGNDARYTKKDVQLSSVLFDNPRGSFTERLHETNAAQLKKGELVTHVKFGEGVVISCKGGIAEIAFPYPHGIKKIAAGHPSLKRKSDMKS